MKRIAIPIFKDRISPVFDTCMRVLIVDFDKGKEVHRQEIYLDKLSLYERQRVLASLNVHVFICGGITETFQKMIKTPDNRFITGKTGGVEEVLGAFFAGKIGNRKFQMPGMK